MNGNFNKKQMYEIYAFENIKNKEKFKQKVQVL